MEKVNLAQKFGKITEFWGIVRDEDELQAFWAPQEASPGAEEEKAA